MSDHDVDATTESLRMTSLGSNNDAGSDLSDNSRSSDGEPWDRRIGSPRKSSVGSVENWTPGESRVEKQESGDIKTAKPKSRLSLLKRISVKKGNSSSSSKEATSNPPPLTKFDKILLEVKVESLPQVFITKYLGYKPCEGLWGIKNTRGPVEEMIAEVSGMDPEKGEDLPLAQLKVSLNGVHVKEHSQNKCKTRHLEKGLIPIEFVSYGVQDVRYTRVFSFILVREMSSKNRKLECHAYVCDSTATCRRLSLSVAMAFQEYSKSLDGKPHKFQVELRADGGDEEADLQPEMSNDGEDFEA